MVRAVFHIFNLAHFSILPETINEYLNVPKPDLNKFYFFILTKFKFYLIGILINCGQQHRTWKAEVAVFSNVSSKVYIKHSLIFNFKPAVN